MMMLTLRQWCSRRRYWWKGMFFSGSCGCFRVDSSSFFKFAESTNWTNPIVCDVLRTFWKAVSPYGIPLACMWSHVRSFLQPKTRTHTHTNTGFVILERMLDWLCVRAVLTSWCGIEASFISVMRGANAQPGEPQMTGGFLNATIPCTRHFAPKFDLASFERASAESVVEFMMIIDIKDEQKMLTMVNQLNKLLANTLMNGQQW